MNSRNFSLTVFFLTAISTACLNVKASTFEDSFESGDLSATNTAGFRWDPPNRTSVVTAQKEVWNKTGRVSIPIPAGSNWAPFQGTHSLRFDYNVDAVWAEQRFNLGRAYPDVWISFWLRVPFNYKHIDGPSSDNGKLLALWMDKYSSEGDGPTLVWSTELVPDGSSDVSIAYSQGGRTGAGQHFQSVRFINYPNDQGRWMQLVFRAKAATTATSNNGVIQLWRRWNGERDFTKLHEILNANIAAPQAGPNGWHFGYILGWMNAPFAQHTEFLVDNFIVSQESLISVRPMPPNSLTIR